MPAVLTMLLVLVVGLLCGGAAAWIASERRTERLRARAEAAERDLAASRAHLAASSGTQEQALSALLERAKNEVRDATAARAGERVGDLVRPMNEQLNQFNALVGGLLARTERLESAATTLSSQTSSLVSALRNPTTRGKWGEMQLRNVVERAGMLEHCDFSEQQTVAIEGVRVRPDLTVHLPGGRCVFVDAKAPLDSMQASLEAPDDALRQELAHKHVKALQDHVDALARRGYQTAKGSVDFVILFVPGESFLSAACNEDPMLTERALDKGVIVTGPIQLISILRMFATGWQAVRQEENAKRIAAIGKELYERAQRFAEHLLKLRRGLESTVDAFNTAVGSYETRLLPQGRKLKDEAALPGDDLPEIAAIDNAVRPITALDAAPEPTRIPRKQELFPPA
ncbi:MAG TPA: DNA recombination protein RmuC [Candidatus Dormibacteraeota bacterium]|nr:DNA recombination protein RmuC [Candidatus Dormibacteraeota bacterium]